MRYRTLAWVMALICGLALPAGAASLAGGFFDQPIFQPGAYETLVSLRAKTRGVVTRNFEARAAVQDRALLTAPATLSKPGSLIAVDNALLVTVNGHETGDRGIGNAMTYNKNTVASVKNDFNNFTGVANVNVAAGNLNTQKTYYSGDLPLNGLANGGSSNLTAIRK